MEKETHEVDVAGRSDPEVGEWERAYSLVLGGRILTRRLDLQYSVQNSCCTFNKALSAPCVSRLQFIPDRISALLQTSTGVTGRPRSRVVVVVGVSSLPRGVFHLPAQTHLRTRADTRVPRVSPALCMIIENPRDTDDARARDVFPRARDLMLRSIRVGSSGRSLAGGGAVSISYTRDPANGEIRVSAAGHSVATA